MFDNDGGVDKFVGDEIVAFFFPVMSGPRHAGPPSAPALGILRATGHADQGGHGSRSGWACRAGLAWVGAVGDEKRTDLTALGDNVNIAARLGGVGRAGEALVTVEAAEAAGLDEPSSGAASS